MMTGETVGIAQSRDSSTIVGLGVSADGSLIAARHPFTSQVALFDAATLRPIGGPIPTGAGSFVPAFPPDRNLVAEGYFGPSSWDLDPDVWQRKACRAAGRNLTGAEWREYLGDEAYRATCPDWPSAD
jgi:hypothetical protein